MRTYFHTQTGDYLGSWNYPPTPEQIDHPSLAGHHWIDGQVGGTQYQFNLATQAMELCAAHTATQYQRDRAQAYPSIVDQLDTLYHGGYEGWRQQIQAVKDRYPKEHP